MEASILKTAFSQQVVNEGKKTTYVSNGLHYKYPCYSVASGDSDDEYLIPFTQIFNIDDKAILGMKILDPEKDSEIVNRKSDIYSKLMGEISLNPRVEDIRKSRKTAIPNKNFLPGTEIFSPDLTQIEVAGYSGLLQALLDYYWLEFVPDHHTFRCSPRTSVSLRSALDEDDGELDLQFAVPPPVSRNQGATNSNARQPSTAPENKKKKPMLSGSENVSLIPRLLQAEYARETNRFLRFFASARGQRYKLFMFYYVFCAFEIFDTQRGILFPKLVLDQGELDIRNRIEALKNERNFWEVYSDAMRAKEIGIVDLLKNRLPKILVVTGEERKKAQKEIRALLESKDHGFSMNIMSFGTIMDRIHTTLCTYRLIYPFTDNDISNIVFDLDQNTIPSLKTEIEVFLKRKNASDSDGKDILTKHWKTMCNGNSRIMDLVYIYKLLTLGVHQISSSSEDEAGKMAIKTGIRDQLRKINEAYLKVTSIYLVQCRTKDDIDNTCNKLFARWTEDLQEAEVAKKGSIEAEKKFWNDYGKYADKLGFKVWAGADKPPEVFDYIKPETQDEVGTRMALMKSWLYGIGRVCLDDITALSRGKCLTDDKIIFDIKSGHLEHANTHLFGVRAWKHWATFLHKNIELIFPTVRNIRHKTRGDQVEELKDKDDTLNVIMNNGKQWTFTNIVSGGREAWGDVLDVLRDVFKFMLNIANNVEPPTNKDEIVKARVNDWVIDLKLARQDAEARGKGVQAVTTATGAIDGLLNMFAVKRDSEGKIVKGETGEYSETKSYDDIKLALDGMTNANIPEKFRYGFLDVKVPGVAGNDQKIEFKPAVLFTNQQKVTEAYEMNPTDGADKYNGSPFAIPPPVGYISLLILRGMFIDVIEALLNINTPRAYIRELVTDYAQTTGVLSFIHAPKFEDRTNISAPYLRGFITAIQLRLIKRNSMLPAPADPTSETRGQHLAEMSKNKSWDDEVSRMNKVLQRAETYIDPFGNKSALSTRTITHRGPRTRLGDFADARGNAVTTKAGTDKRVEEQKNSSGGGGDKTDMEYGEGV